MPPMPPVPQDYRKSLLCNANKKLNECNKNVVYFGALSYDK